MATLHIQTNPTTCAQSPQQAGWRLAILYPEAAKIKIMPFTKIYTNLLWACIRSTYSSRWAHNNRSTCTNASVPFLGKRSWLKPRFSEVPAWCAEPLTDTQNTQLVLVNSGITRTNVDLHHPTKLEHFFLHIHSLRSVEPYQKEGSGRSFTKNNLHDRKIRRHDYLNELL